MTGFDEPTVMSDRGLNLIHRDTVVGIGTTIEHVVVIEPQASIGFNCFIGYYTIIRPRVVIGNRSEVRCHCYIAEDVHIGKNTQIFQFSNIGKGTVIEDYCWIGAHVMITNTKRIAYLRPYDTKITPCRIKEGSRIASNATLMPGVNIGRNALIGAGSVVTCDVPEGEVWFGNPARKIKDVHPEDIPTPWEPLFNMEDE